jgi:VWFA-related protein
MKRLVWLVLTAVGMAAQEDVVFRSDTTLVRVDVQVLDQNNRAISGLDAEAFVLREQGQVRAVKNFVREDMPIDLLFLIDVSGSMRPHVERMAEAARRSLPSLRREDRVAVMVFDRQSRVRMPFRPGHNEAQREFDNLLRSETFNGGTDITRAMFDAATFMKRQARKEARRAIVLLTDDQTEFNADEAGVVRSLQQAETVMSVLLVPAMVPRGMGTGGNPRRGGGGNWGGVVIHGPSIPGLPGGGQGPGGGWAKGRAAGSAEIARESGGDAMQADAASALETTLNRLRQRYGLHFNLPAGVRAGDRRSIEVALQERVGLRYPGATLRYRHYYVAAVTSGSGAPEEEILETVPVRKAEPVITKRRTMDGSSSKGPGIVVH